MPSGVTGNCLTLAGPYNLRGPSNSRGGGWEEEAPGALITVLVAYFPASVAPETK